MNIYFLYLLMVLEIIAGFMIIIVIFLDSHPPSPPGLRNKSSLQVITSIQKALSV